MRYFIVGEDTEVHRARVFSAVDSEGEPVDGRETSVDRATITLQQQGRYVDRLLSIGNELVISERAWNIISQFIGSDCAQCLPLNVVTKRGVVIDTAPAYCMVWSDRVYDPINYEASVCDYFKPPPPGVIRNIKEWVLSSERLPKCGFFLAPYRNWIVSSVIVDELVAARCEGFRFVPVRVQ